MSVKPLTRFSWEQLVLGDAGPASPITRLVLVAIGSYVRRKGSLECWPSIRVLETATQLSRPTLLAHIDQAVAGGWIKVHLGQTGEMKRRGNIYVLTAPTGKPPLPVSSSETGKPPLHVGDVQPVNQNAPTGKAEAARPVKLARSLLTSEVEGNKKNLEVGSLKTFFQSLEVNLKQKRKPAQQEGLDRWASEQGIERDANETDEVWKRRLTDAWLKAVGTKSDTGPDLRDPDRVASA